MNRVAPCSAVSWVPPALRDVGWNYGEPGQSHACWIIGRAPELTAGQQTFEQIGPQDYPPQPPAGSTFGDPLISSQTIADDFIIDSAARDVAFWEWPVSYVAFELTSTKIVLLPAHAAHRAAALRRQFLQRGHLLLQRELRDLRAQGRRLHAAVLPAVRVTRPRHEGVPRWFAST